MADVPFERGGLWQMPTFLAVASVTNVWFLCTAIRDQRAAARQGADGLEGSAAKANTLPAPAARALLTMAGVELFWVVPCFLQCLFVLIAGNQPDKGWSPYNSTGCAIQGLYSLFSSLAGMACSAQMAYMTYGLIARERVPTLRVVTMQSAAIVGGGLLAGLLPLMGAGEYKNSGDGFCYVDWAQGFHVFLIVLFLLPTTCVVVACYLAVVQSDKYESARLPAKSVWCCFGGYFVVTWAAWYIASVESIGALAGGSTPVFPDHIMITGGILGHLTAIVNPILFGVCWRRWMSTWCASSVGLEMHAKLETPGLP